MVQKLNIHGLGRLPQLARDVHVRGARRRIPARMIVLCCAQTYVEWTATCRSHFALRGSEIAAHNLADNQARLARSAVAI
ncbi:MAG: hypothetical protein Q8N18_18955, partial [Opitutaceae bacterium]|nr:hypothetical protein [Opitutaceae bacterium]